MRHIVATRKLLRQKDKLVKSTKTNLQSVKKFYHRRYSFYSSNFLCRYRKRRRSSENLKSLENPSNSHNIWIIQGPGCCVKISQSPGCHNCKCLYSIESRLARWVYRGVHAATRIASSRGVSPHLLISSAPQLLSSSSPASLHRGSTLIFVRNNHDRRRLTATNINVPDPFFFCKAFKKLPEDSR